MQSSNYYQPNPQQQYMLQPPMVDDNAISHAPPGSGGGEEDDSDGSGMPDKRSGRRKIKIEYINDKSRRHITFSKRKAGIMKKAYELSTLTGTQVLLLVVSETGLVYTFTTPKLQPLVTKPEGKNLIQSCLNAPDPIDSNSSSSMDHHHQQAQQQSRSVMTTNNAPTSPPTTNSNYYRPNQSLDTSSNGTYTDDRKSFGSMVAANPPLILNGAPGTASSEHQQVSSNYNPMAYPSYNTTSANSNTSSSASSLYPYNLPAQQQPDNNRYWNSNTLTNNTSKRQDNVKR
ncbi:SRF-TF-domain-containing protein [Mucor ambiguus]|uniref:SRF-TF-domain-containing protein n=1 Tax=Mucor ambiguus TaxID=91626 RepID=A0A0C9MX76_9FUNG|nr:SRF-TF-domain-containing protein [Mucor ambiguus]